MSTTATLPAEGNASYADSHGRDFSDWVSPILVKELRQGLSTKVFVVAFIIIQVVMVLLLGMRLLDDTTEEVFGTGKLIDGLLWTAMGATLLVFMPARGLTAVSEEVKANTLDLVALTKMGSFRIVLGKWLALLFQTLLITVAVLPYAVLRYFFGQVDLVGDLETLAWMLCASCVLISGAVALSTLPLGSRIVMVLLAVPGVWIVAGLLFSRAVFGFTTISSTVGSAMIFTLMIALLTLLYTAFFLLEAAAKIAPAAQQHPWMRRVLALCAAALPLIAFFTLGGKDSCTAFLVVTTPIAIWAVIISLTERVGQLPVTFVPWEKRGIPGRVAGLLFHAGWPSGMIFTAIITMLFFQAVALIDPTTKNLTLITWLTYVALVMPVILEILFPRSKSRFGLYLLGHLLVLLWWIFVVIGTKEDDGSILQAVFPGSAVVNLLGSDQRIAAVVNASSIGLVSSGIIMVFLIIAWFRETRQILAMHREARIIIERRPGGTSK